MKVINYRIYDNNGVPYIDNGGPYIYSKVKKFDHGPQYQFHDTYCQLENIVIHHTVSGSWMSAHNALNDPGKEAGSAHLFIDRDGTVVQCVPFNTFAWHAGDRRWADRGLRSGPSNLNYYSIRIELVNWGLISSRRGMDGRMPNIMSQ